MNDVDDDLRELLRRRADDVPAHRDVPRSLVRRANRRIARNALSVALTVVVLAVGAVAGLRAVGAPGRVPVGQTPSPTVQHSPSGPASSACTSAQLQAAASLEGAAGSRAGAFVLTNSSDQACTLEGRPIITLLDGNGNPITSGVTFDPTQPSWDVNQRTQPAGWPVVTLQPGDVASLRISWSNWCPDGRTVPVWRIDLAAGGGGGTVDVTGMDAVGPPPCNGPGQPSIVQEGPFEPGTGA